MNCQTHIVTAQRVNLNETARATFGEAWKVTKGRTKAPAPELPLASESFALSVETQAAQTPAGSEEAPQYSTPDLFL